MSPEADEEIELLKAIYGDEAVELRDQRVLVSLQPRVGQGTALVSATVALCLPDGYPAVAPEVMIEKSRGLMDSGVSALTAAAKAAVEQYGAGEDGCLCQVMAEVNEALDLANDESECLICLQACGSVTDASVVHAPCDHVYHATCLGHWANLKKSEARAAVEDSTQSVRSQRDALAREVAELSAQLVDLAEEISRMEELLLELQSKRQMQLRQIEEGEEMEEEPDEPSLEEQLATVKDDLKSCLAKKRKSETRCKDLSGDLGVLEDQLKASTGNVDAAGLPCPVCRAPIPQDLLPVAVDSASATSVASGPFAASVESLPQELRKQVRQLQKQHQAILEERRKKEEMQQIKDMKAAEEAAEAERQKKASGWESEGSAQWEWQPSDRNGGYHEWQGASKGKGRREDAQWKQSGTGGKASSGKSNGRNRWNRT